MPQDHLSLSRREFFVAPLLAAAAQLPGEALAPAGLTGGIRRETGVAPLESAVWYTAETEGAALVYRLQTGALTKARYLAADMLADGDTIQAFSLTLHEQSQGRVFSLSFGALPQCSLRIRLPLALVDQSRWLADREGAFLKPRCGGDRVDLAQVNEIRLTLRRKAPRRVARFCLTPLYASLEEPPKLARPVLPRGPLVDEFGQSAIREWPGRTRSEKELTDRIRAQHAAASKRTWPAFFSRWGGWREKKLGQRSGFFRVQHDGRRWWLVDPDGCAFWSAGVDCVRVDAEARIDGIESALKWAPAPDSPMAAALKDAAGKSRRGNEKYVNFLAMNLMRAFGTERWREAWAVVALAELRRLRFNTVGNWSQWEYASRARFPYVRPLTFRALRSGWIYRDFPDVWHPEFASDAAAYASQLNDTRDDPALIGYFLMNEPTWAFSSEPPALGMLYNTETCHTRKELVSFFQRKYENERALAAAWKMPVSFEALAAGKWRGRFTQEAVADLRAFSSRMVERYFQEISTACKKADPNHLNLGMRWAGVPPEWAASAMKHFDVFSLNCYMDKLPRDRTERIHELVKVPVLVGEWHFGALDVGLPASGIGHLRNQTERAKAYRVYLEDAAANPHCVGVHWFTLYDQSALGRFDGENYNIGFFDICHRPYPEMEQAAILSHERMYSIAAGKVEPFDEKLEYLPKLFL
jgi:hypothetical protein